MTEKQIPDNERRKFERLNINNKMQLFSGTAAYTCDIIDISLKGLLFSRPADWAGKSKDIFRLTITIVNSPSISMSVEIAHVDKKSIGAKWNKIDVGSFSRLKRLIELNTLDKHKISKEISKL